ncbi:hypothetical protein GCM10010412_100730 [Nonomuraea recticatena]|uniref:Transposase Helix-turn-helix domain-containing protein n=1 Tax=Nonomuraea recticatena TaxID=46178 RepID=A0ABP6FY44_9ACTN
MLFYRAALPLSRRTLTFLSGIIRRHCKKIGFRWRRLNLGQPAMLTFVHLRKGETLIELAAGFAVGATTVWRYIRQAIALLAGRAPHLDQALRAAQRVITPSWCWMAS